MSTASIAPEPPTAGSAATRETVPQPRSALPALVRFESRRLLAHPLFIAGIVASIGILVTASGNGSQDLDTLAGYSFTFIGAAIWTCLAAGLAAGRVSRDDAQDLYAGQPVAPRVRTQAALLSLGSAGLVAATLIAVATLARAGADGALIVDGERYPLRPLELAQGPIFVVLAGVLGVLVATWSKRVYPIVIAALVLFSPLVAWGPWLVFGDDVPRGFESNSLTGASVGWHLVGLVGLTSLLAAGALARHDRRARVALLALAGLGATVAGIALGMPHPPPGT